MAHSNAPFIAGSKANFCFNCVSFSHGAAGNPVRGNPCVISRSSRPPPILTCSCMETTTGPNGRQVEKPRGGAGWIRQGRLEGSFYNFRILSTVQRYGPRLDGCEQREHGAQANRFGFTVSWAKHSGGGGCCSSSGRRGSTRGNTKRSAGLLAIVKIPVSAMLSSTNN